MRPVVCFGMACPGSGTGPGLHWLWRWRHGAGATPVIDIIVLCSNSSSSCPGTKTSSAAGTTAPSGGPVVASINKPIFIRENQACGPLAATLAQNTYALQHCLVHASFATMRDTANNTLIKKCFTANQGLQISSAPFAANRKKFLGTITLQLKSLDTLDIVTLLKAIVQKRLMQLPRCHGRGRLIGADLQTVLRVGQASPASQFSPCSITQLPLLVLPTRIFDASGEACLFKLLQCGQHLCLFSAHCEHAYTFPSLRCKQFTQNRRHSA